MLNKCFLILATSFAVNSFALNSNAQVIETKGSLQSSAVEEQVEELIEFTELEYQLLEASNLLSLSQQIKYSAQHLIEQGTERPQPAGASDVESDNKTENQPIYINHAR